MANPNKILLLAVAALCVQGAKGQPAPLENCHGVAQGTSEFGPIMYIVADIITGSGGTLWKAKIPVQSYSQMESVKITSASLDATRTKVALLNSLNPEKIVVADSAGQVHTFTPTPPIPGMTISDVTWEGGDSMKIKYSGRVESMIRYVQIANWPISPVLIESGAWNFASACTKSPSYVEPVCVVAQQIVTGQTKIQGYLYADPIWQPGAEAQVSGQLTAGTAWSVNAQPLFEIKLLSSMGPEARFEIKSDIGTTEITADALAFEFIDTSGDKQFYVSTRGPGTQRLTVTRFSADLPLASFSNIVDIGSNGFLAFVDNRTEGVTDLLSFAKIQNGTVKEEGAPSFVSLGRDVRGIRRVRQTNHLTFELQGAFGFMEIGYSIGSPWSVGIGQIEQRPQTHPSSPSKPMLEWRCI